MKKKSSGIKLFENDTVAKRLRRYNTGIISLRYTGGRRLFTDSKLNTHTHTHRFPNLLTSEDSSVASSFNREKVVPLYCAPLLQGELSRRHITILSIGIKQRRRSQLFTVMYGLVRKSHAPNTDAAILIQSVTSLLLDCQCGNSSSNGC